MPQTIDPQPSTKPHPRLDAPPGTVMYDPATCVGPGGELPYVAYPIPDHPNIDTRFAGEPLAAEGQVRVRRVPAEVAATDLAWWPTLPAPRLATDEEVLAYLAAHGG